LSAWIQSWLLFSRLYKGGIYKPAARWGRFALQLLAASVTMTILLSYVTPAPAAWNLLPSWERALTLGTLVGGGSAIYFAVLWLSGIRLGHFRDHH
jgi:putative peptidoglycan lipid II flippase